MTQESWEDKVPTLLALLLEQAHQHALLLLDVDGRIIAWLAGAEQVFGYRREDILGKHSGTLFTPEDVELGLPAHELNTARESGKAEDDRWMRRKDGSRIWVIGITYGIRDGEGRLAGFGKVMRDMTHLKAQINTLETRLEKSSETDVRRLTLMGAVAHELGNVFAALNMTLEYERGRNVPGPPNQAFDAIQREISLSRRLLDDLKEIGRIGAGRLALKKESLVLNEALRQAADICRPLFEERRQRFDVLLPAAPIQLEADPTRLHQIFINLLNNSAKYTPEGGIIRMIMTTEGQQAIVRVSDTGVGIGPSIMPRLFELFTQEENPVGHSRGGVGLGLWLVKNLVDLHGGTIGVRSDGKGKGSEFIVRLPWKQE